LSKYTLYRIEGADRIEVSAFDTLREGFSAGQDAVHVDAVHAYALYQGAGRVARFAFSRLEASEAASLDGLVIS